MPVSPTDLKLLTLLRCCGPLAPLALTRRYRGRQAIGGYDRDLVSMGLWRLKLDGLVERVSPSRWDCTEAGKVWLEHHWSVEREDVLVRIAT